MKGERSLDEEEVKSRSKRGACTGQTGLFGILFGVAYQPNIDCVNQELEKFRGDVSGNINNIKVIQNRMGNEHNKEMQETKSMVHKVRRKSFLCSYLCYIVCSVFCSDQLNF